MQYRTTSYAEGVFDTFWFEKNLQGDIIAVYNDAGTLLATYAYDAWGGIASLRYSNGGSSTAAQYNPFRYRGYYRDSETGFYYLNSRYYDPSTGRFVNADVYTDTGMGIIGNNMYAYCNNDPISLSDPEGTYGMASIQMINFEHGYGGFTPVELTISEQYILDAAIEFGIHPALIAGCIWTERSNNVDMADYLFDFGAGLFRDAQSIGLGQIQVKTARDIIECVEGIDASSSRLQLILRLSDDRTNARYVAAYIWYLNSKWEKEYPEFLNDPEIVWTVYNTGKTDAHPNPKPGINSDDMKMYYNMYKFRFRGYYL